ncbi:hypothetical protein CEXT_703351 [Caerostris extrusa]|uniref:Uncharacterized protein n=1 Tax=Caerostris extrusa TaxID=172846 RepID=A0AAV4RK90_CAEEX|nr:hypothetical protein CEXT_703351 [Caerostris extrusa]
MEGVESFSVTVNSRTGKTYSDLDLWRGNTDGILNPFEAENASSRIIYRRELWKGCEPNGELIVHQNSLPFGSQLFQHFSSINNTRECVFPPSNGYKIPSLFPALNPVNGRETKIKKKHSFRHFPSNKEESQQMEGVESFSVTVNSRTRQTYFTPGFMAGEQNGDFKPI